MSDRTSSRIRLVLLAPTLLLVAFAVLRGPEPALAHAHYDHSNPAIGQVLATSPPRVDIFTDSEMRKTADANIITVTGADGSRVDGGTTVLDDANRQHFSVGLNPNLPPGRYVVAFQTLSDADGDTDHGRFAFYVGSGPTPQQQALDASLNGAPQPAAATSPSSSSFGGPLIILASGLLLLLVVVGALFALRRARRWHP